VAGTFLVIRLVGFYHKGLLPVVDTRKDTLCRWCLVTVVEFHPVTLVECLAVATTMGVLTNAVIDANYYKQNVVFVKRILIDWFWNLFQKCCSM